MRKGHIHAGFFNENQSRHEGIKKRMEEWGKMNAEEKVNCINERIEDMVRDENAFRGFFALKGLGADIKNHFRERWEEMSAEEKQDFIRAKEEMIKKGSFSHTCFFRDTTFRAETVDHFCEKWMAKTPEEKEEIINKRKEAFRRVDFRRRGNSCHEHRMSAKKEESPED